MLVDAEHAGPLIQRLDDLLETTEPAARLAFPFPVHRLDRAGLRDQVRDLVVCPACSTPGADFGVRQILPAVLDTGDLREMKAGQLG